MVYDFLSMTRLLDPFCSILHGVLKTSLILENRRITPNPL